MYKCPERSFGSSGVKDGKQYVKSEFKVSSVPCKEIAVRHAHLSSHALLIPNTIKLHPQDSAD